MRWRIRKYLIIIGILLLCLMPFKASARTVSGIYAFGDSLSDTGNVFHASLQVAGTGIPAPPYFEGRFSNGYLWIDYLAKRLGFALMPATELSSNRSLARAISFAYGGATTGTDNTVSTALPGLQQEVEQFQQFSTQQKIDPNALYTLWVGANDYLPNDRELASYREPTQPVDNISAAIQSLYSSGARQFLIANLPALGETPLAQNLNSEAVLSLNRLTQEHNQSLNRQLDTLQRRFPQIHLIRLDVNRLLNQAIIGQLGFTNVKTPCFNRSTGKVCTNPDRYLFWDALHPTTAAHRYIGESAAQTLQTKLSQRPIFPTFSGLVLLGTVGLLVSVGAWHSK